MLRKNGPGSPIFGLVTQMRNFRIVTMMNSPAVQSLHLIFYYLPTAPFFARHWRRAAISLSYPISDALY